jgi:hypothetical protein
VTSAATERARRSPTRASARGSVLPDLAGFGLVLLPVIAMLWLATHGGGYTIDDWGVLAALICLGLATALVLIDQPLPRLTQLAAPGCLFGLAAWSLVSLSWAGWPENAVAESARYIFYGCVMLLGLVATGRPGVRRAAVLSVAGASGLLALVIAYGLWNESVAQDAFVLGRLVGSIGYAGGLAAVVAIGVWPLAGFASDRLTAIALRVLAGAGAGAAFALVVPTGARAAVVALAVSGVAYLAISPTPLRCAMVVGPIVAITALRWDELNGVFAGGQAGGQVQDVGRAVVQAAVVGACVALIQSLLDTRVTLGGRARAWASRLGVVTAVVIAGAALGAALHAMHGDPSGWMRDKWHTFQQAGNPYQGDVDTRFASVGGGRYDLWRVAVLEFHRHPLQGVGAGNFARAYFAEGRSRAQPQQAHSEPLEVAATTGLPGLLLFAPAVLLPIGFAVRARFRARLPSERLLAAGIAAALIEFAVHSSIDWTWHIAADAVPAMLLAGAALGTASSPVRLPGGMRRAAVSAAAAAAVLLAAAVVILPAAVAQGALTSSYSESAADAIDHASEAKRYDRLSSRPDVAAARAYLRAGDAAGALTAARRAVGEEPEFWVGWQLRFLAARQLGYGAEAAAARAEVARLNASLPLDLRFQVPPTAYDHY